jgi:TetR/AcrR family tetracycline transcriptional repressor
VPRDEGSSRPPAGLTTAALGRATLHVVAERGVAGVTMAEVATRLGVRAPSLYHHVRDKAALLQLAASEALAGFDDDRVAYGAVRDLDGWVALTAEGSRRLRRHYLAHPGLAALMQTTALPDRDQLPGRRGALVRAQVEALVRLGVPPVAAGSAFSTCARWTLAAVAADSSGAPGGDADSFDRGLRWLLHGLRAELDALIRIPPPSTSGE